MPLPVPPGPVMTRSSGPAPPGGVVRSISVPETTLKLAPLAPMVTEVAPANPLPVRTTESPPAVVPEVGETAVRSGAGT